MDKTKEELIAGLESMLQKLKDHPEIAAEVLNSSTGKFLTEIIARTVDGTISLEEAERWLDAEEKQSDGTTAERPN
jgi:hypothetical protein